MGLFDFLRGKQAVDRSARLRDALFSHIETQNWAALGELCATHHDEIVREFSHWKTGPTAIRGDQVAMQRFASSLGTLATFFAQNRAEPRLLQELVGPEDGNPIARTQKKLSEVEAQLDKLEFESAIENLHELLQELQPYQDVSGNFVTTQLSKTWGHIGFCFFQLCQMDRATEPLERALALCQSNNDADGIVTYLWNLLEVHRYAGQAAAAARYAERLAETLAVQGNAGRAAWFRKQAAVIRDGEPLVRVVAQFSGQNHELDEITIPSGTRFHLVLYRNRLTLLRARHRCREAEQHFLDGRPRESLQSLVEAARHDPYEPEPHYQMGVLALYSACYDYAIASYERAETLAPGWLHCRRYLWLARQLALGRFEHETFLTLQALDGCRTDRTSAEKVALARDALTKSPDLAWLNLCLGGYLKELGQQSAAEASFRRGLETVEEPDVECCLMLELAMLLDWRSAERATLLADASNLQGNLVAAASARLASQFDYERHSR